MSERWLLYGAYGYTDSLIAQLAFVHGAGPFWLCGARNRFVKRPSSWGFNRAFDAEGGSSPGTLASSLRGLALGCRIRRKGSLRPVPLAYENRTISFPHGQAYRGCPYHAKWL